MKMKKIILIALVMKTILISINKVKIVHESIVGWKWKCAKLSHFHHLAYKYLCDNECAYLKKNDIQIHFYVYILVDVSAQLLFHFDIFFVPCFLCAFGGNYFLEKCNSSICFYRITQSNWEFFVFYGHLFLFLMNRTIYFESPF